MRPICWTTGLSITLMSLPPFTVYPASQGFFFTVTDLSWLFAGLKYSFLHFLIDCSDSGNTHVYLLKQEKGGFWISLHKRQDDSSAQVLSGAFWQLRELICHPRGHSGQWILSALTHQMATPWFWDKQNSKKNDDVCVRVSMATAAHYFPSVPSVCS